MTPRDYVHPGVGDDETVNKSKSYRKENHNDENQPDRHAIAVNLLSGYSGINYCA